MKMYNPPHPGEIIKELVMIPLGFDTLESARRIGIKEAELAAIISGDKPLTVDIAYALGIATGIGIEFWANLQLQFDCSHAKTKYYNPVVAPDSLAIAS